MDEKLLKLLKAYLPYASLIVMAWVCKFLFNVNQQTTIERLREKDEIARAWHDLYIYSEHEIKKRAHDYDDSSKNSIRNSDKPDAR